MSRRYWYASSEKLRRKHVSHTIALQPARKGLSIENTHTDTYSWNPFVILFTIIFQFHIKVSKSKQCTAVWHQLSSSPLWETHMPYVITQCYLPPDRCKNPAFTPSRSRYSI